MFRHVRERHWTLMGLGVALAAVIAASCVPMSPAETPDRCQHIVKYPCLTPRVCYYDAAHGCQICRCGPPAYVPPDNLDLRPSLQ